MYSQGGSSCKRYSASSMSFSVNAAQSISTSGTFTPFLALSMPPRTTLTFNSVSDNFSTTFTFINPSSINKSIPGLAAFTRALCSMVDFMVMRPGRRLSLSSLLMPNSKISPLVKGTGSPANSPTRNFGPCKSPRTSTLRPNSLAYLRIKGYTRSKSPPRRCEQFRRKMSVPASIILGIISSLQEAGPKLATTLVLRLLSSVSCLFKAMPQFSILGGLRGAEPLTATYGQDCFTRCLTVSASRTAEASAITASHGYFPLAASPLSITASVPSQTEFCKSLTSARVGTGCSIMLSTICVAVMTKRPASLAFLINNFWAKGTRSTSSSTPKSPRATIKA
mmetsp:Transcript_144080/g.365710  ORF Transcript_144080/g.365710 Transcript_144080/m.365710 type:complete len:337 (+) Transcript_144080:522-1532(+)